MHSGSAENRGRQVPGVVNRNLSPKAKMSQESSYKVLTFMGICKVLVRFIPFSKRLQTQCLNVNKWMNLSIPSAKPGMYHDVTRGRISYPSKNDDPDRGQ